MTDIVPGRADVTIYSTAWCGPCARLKQRLTDRGIDFVDVDIETDPEGAALLVSFNDGNLLVPTVRFSDGSTLTNPGVEAVAERLTRLRSSGASASG